jgi:hypothetical protein
MTTSDTSPDRTLSRAERFNNAFWLAIARRLPRNLAYACASLC